MLNPETIFGLNQYRKIPAASIPALVILLLSACVQTGQEPFSTGNFNASEDSEKPATEIATLNFNPQLCGSGESAQVTKIIDGDTIDVLMADSSEERVRYIGIDTPERDETCYRESSDRNTELVAGDTVQLIKDSSERDIYGRLVRYICNSDGVFVNAQLIADGVAHAYRYHPDTGFADHFKSLEQEAARAGRGCLHPDAEHDSEAPDSACCKICRNGKACGNSCIPWNQNCQREPGCACQG